MKKVLLVLVAIIFTINLNTHAEDFSAVYNGKTIYYNITSSVYPFTVSVTYRGNSYYSYPKGYSGSITIPDSVQYNSNYYKVTSIDDYAFYDCVELTSMTIPNSVISIGNRAFFGTPYFNNMLDGLVYINNILYIYKGTMPANTSISIQTGTVSISDHAFYDCSGLTSITIPNSVTYIGDSAFTYCTSLTSINIPNNVTSIRSGVFQNCSGLNSVSIPNSVTSIGHLAFYDCSGLTSITIPNSVTSIGYDAFYNCNSLTSITCNAIIPPAIQWSSFSGVSNLIPVFVPCESITDYKTSPSWSEFTNIQCDVSLNNISNNISTKLYPNPNNGKAKLEIVGLDSQADVLVYDMLGRVVLSYKINQGEKVLDIDLSGYAKGVYTVRVVNDKLNYTEKLILK
jgi:hypothetical protein